MRNPAYEKLTLYSTSTPPHHTNHSLQSNTKKG